MKKGYHCAPNGKPSKLTEDQWLLVRTPNFKKWFGDWENDPKNASKVVDENGEPLVVYHGTNWDWRKERSGDAKFKNSFVRNSSEGFGFNFTRDKTLASGFGEVVPVFLNLKNPVYAYSQLNMLSAEEIYDRIKSALPEKFPVARLEEKSNLKYYWDWFKENLLNKEIETAIRRKAVFKEGHFLKLIAGGKNKGFIKGYSEWSSAKQAIENGKVLLDNEETAPEGFSMARARQMPLVLDVLQNPQFVLKDKKLKDFLFIKKYEGGNSWVAVMFNSSDMGIISWHTRDFTMSNIRRSELIYQKNGIDFLAQPRKSSMEENSSINGYLQSQNSSESQEENSTYLKSLLRQERGENPVIWASIVLAREILLGKPITNAKIEKLLPADKFDGTKRQYALDRAHVIKEAIDAGHKVFLAQIYNDPITSWRNSIERGIAIGRFLPLKYFVERAYERARGKVAKIENELNPKYGEKLETFYIDSTENNPIVVSPDEALAWDYSVNQEQLRKIEEITYEYKGKIEDSARDRKDKKNPLAVITSGIREIDGHLIYRNVSFARIVPERISGRDKQGNAGNKQGISSQARKGRSGSSFLKSLLRQERGENPVIWASIFLAREIPQQRNNKGAVSKCRPPTCNQSRCKKHLHWRR